MKRITLLCAFVLANVAIFAQTNPCPDIQSHGLVPVSNSGSTCSAKVFANATGDVASQKSLQITVYAGAIMPANIVSQECFVVAAGSPSTKYETAVFSAPCASDLTYVLRRGTSSNGLCGGGECGTTVTVSSGPLPIKLGAFYAKRNKSNVELSWKTEAEINAKGFIIQRLVKGNYVDVAEVAATNVSNGASYSYVDANAGTSVNQYRLKLIDIDGSFTYSDVRSVKGSAGAASDFVIFPNPSRGDAKVTVSDISEPTDVQLIDHSGRVIKVISMDNRNTVDFNNLQTGMYMIRIVNKTSGEASTKKLNVLN
jgi:hypothetical protein